MSTLHFPSIVIGMAGSAVLCEEWYRWTILPKWKKAVEFAQQRSFYLGQVQQFTAGGDHPYFEQVKGMMATLLQNGQAADLQDAYDKALAVFAVDHQFKKARAE